MMAWFRAGGWLLAGLVLTTILPAQEGVPADEQVRPFDRVIFENASGKLQELTCLVRGRSPTFLTVERVNDDGKLVGEFKLRTDVVKEILPRQDASTVYKVKFDKLPGRDADPAERATALLNLARWARLPLLENSGEPPRPEAAYKLLLQAARLKPDRVEVYPHLLDEMAARQHAGELTADEEMEILLLARQGGYRSREVLFRFGEKYLEMGEELKAREMFQGALDLEGPPNHSIASRCRRYLAEIHILEGEVERALGLFSVDVPGVDPFEAHFLTARLLLLSGGEPTRAREHLEQAAKLQPGYPGVVIQLAALDLLEGKVQQAASRLTRTLTEAGDEIDLLNALALVNLERGRFTRAVRNLQSATPLAGEEASSGRCELYLVRGMLRDFLGDPVRAAEEYKIAWDSAPWNRSSALRLLSGLLHARASLVAGDREAPRQILDRLLATGASDPAVFAASARLLADVEVADGKIGRALSLLDHAIAFRPDDARLRVKQAQLLLGEDRLDAAFAHLQEALRLEPERPDLQCALGYYHYSSGDMNRAEEAFRKAIKILPAKPPARPGESQKREIELRAYALRGLEQVIDVKRLEQWEDRFDRDDTPDILRGWSKVDNFGIRVELRDRKILFEGAQKAEADGVSMIYREELGQNFERVSVRLRFPVGSPARGGLRVLTDPKDLAAGLAVYRDHGGQLGYATKSARGQWEVGQVTASDEEPSSGKTVFTGEATWPDDGEFHVLSIEKADPRKGGKGYHLLLDGKIFAHNVNVSGLTSTGRRPLYFAVYGQASALDQSYEFGADDFRLFRVRPSYSEDR